MADLTQLETALRNADKAGDTAAARMLAAEIMRQRGAQPAPQQSPAMDPSEGGTNFRPLGIDTGLQMPQGVSRFLAGAGKSMMDVRRGAGQLMGLVDRAEIDEVQSRDRALTDTGAGTAGQIAGGVAMSLPAMLAGPGGSTIAAQAAMGGAQGALQPVGAGESRLKNMAVGGAAGAALPAALRAGKVLKAGLVDPFTDAGQQRIVGGALNRSAANPAEAMANLQTARGATPGFLPTAGQVSGDAGIASLERTARGIDPAGFGDIDTEQRAALAGALRKIAGTPETKRAATLARDDATTALYRQAKDVSIPVDGELSALMQRPSMQAATSDAKGLAAERGKTFIEPEGPPSLTGENLHDIKLSLDTLFQDPTKGIVGAKRQAADGTRREFLDLLAGRIPEYDQARKAYAAMSEPINRQEVGQELYNRLVPAVADTGDAPFNISPARYAQALRSGDDLASSVTGMKGARMDKLMGAENMRVLNGVRDDAQSIAAGQAAGRGVGSDTVQKMAMSNLIDQAGLPSWIGALAPLRPLGGWVQTAGNMLYKSNDEKMRHLLADVLKDPARAAEAMKKADVTPSQYAEYLRKVGAVSNQALPSAALQE